MRFWTVGDGRIVGRERGNSRCPVPAPGTAVPLVDDRRKHSVDVVIATISHAYFTLHSPHQSLDFTSGSE
jgi:hypothetical protein